MIDHTQYFESLVPRILSGELTRNQAADMAHQETGYKQSTFLVWLHSSGNAKKLKGVRGSSGPRSVHSHAKNDPDKAKAYEDAVATVLAGQTGAYAAKKYDVNYQYLMNIVKKRKSVGATSPTTSTSEYLNTILKDSTKAERLAHLAKAMGL